MGQCLKCGKETEGKAVFCGECQSVMDKHPVKPGTVIHLLPRPATPEKKTQRYSGPTQAEQLEKVRKTVRVLVGLVAVLSLLLTATAVMLLRTLTEDVPEVPIGRNYTTVG